MEFGFILLSVLSLLMFFIFLILGNKSLIQSPEVKAIIDIVTVFIGVMSFVSGMVSIKVMLSQEKIQEELLEAQKREHQPNFMIDYKGITMSYGMSVDYLAYPGIYQKGTQRGCTMITCKPDSTFSIDKYNFYSERYDLEGFEREDVTMQFENVTIVPDELRK